MRTYAFLPKRRANKISNTEKSLRALDKGARLLITAIDVYPIPETEKRKGNAKVCGAGGRDAGG